jgi:protein SCO1/2
MTLTSIRLTLLAFAGLAAGAMTALAVLPQARERLLPSGNVKVSGEPLIGGTFTLVDHAGKTVTDGDFRGRTMLVVFGAVASPDATAATLQVLSGALARLSAKAEGVAPVLVVVDGEHVPRERLAHLVVGFDPRPVVLTGTFEQIGGVLAAYRVPGIRMGDDLGSLASYKIFNAPPVYVMGPDGRYRGHFSFTAGTAALAASLADML